MDPEGPWSTWAPWGAWCPWPHLAHGLLGTYGSWSRPRPFLIGGRSPKTILGKWHVPSQRSKHACIVFPKGYTNTLNVPTPYTVVAFDAGSWVQDPGSWIVDPRFKILYGPRSEFGPLLSLAPISARWDHLGVGRMWAHCTWVPFGSNFGLGPIRPIGSIWA